LIVVVMAPKKVAKGAPKRGEKVNPTDTRPKIVVETVNSPDVSVEDVPFDAVEAPQAAATTAHVEGEDEEVPVRFNPTQIRTRAETTAARRFAKEAGLMGSESAVPNLFGGHTELETAVGTILERGLSRFGCGFDEPARSTDLLAYGDPFSRRQNRRDGDFRRQEAENTPTARDVSHVKGNSGVSEVDYRRYGRETTSTMRPYGSMETGIRGGDENRYESEAHAGTGIFANAFADQWTAQQNDPGSEDKWVCSEIIQNIIDLCGFSADSLMVRYMDQQQWSE
jgi:hypothetical protein